MQVLHFFIIVFSLQLLKLLPQNRDWLAHRMGLVLDLRPSKLGYLKIIHRDLTTFKIVLLQLVHDELKIIECLGWFIL